MVQIPSFIRARLLAKTLKVDVKRVLREAGAVKRDKRIHWLNHETQQQHQFGNVKEVIFPFDAATQICSNLGHDACDITLKQVEPVMAVETWRGGSAGTTVPRLPVVVVLGHRDHGKTTLIDKLREGSGAVATAPQEVGGITQMVSAYSAVIGGVEMTLLDTPGHEHFYMMREDGATMADCAAVLVASDMGPGAESWECLERVIKPPLHTNHSSSNHSLFSGGRHWASHSNRREQSRSERPC